MWGRWVGGGKGSQKPRAARPVGAAKVWGLALPLTSPMLHSPDRHSLRLAPLQRAEGHKGATSTLQYPPLWRGCSAAIDRL